jgi:hypothetical protein
MSPCPIIPFFCPRILCPFYIKRDIYVKDTQNAMYEIKKIRSKAMEYYRTEQKRLISDEVSITSEFS